MSLTVEEIIIDAPISLGGGGAGAVAVADEGTNVVNAAARLNFIGSGVTASQDGSSADQANITIAAGAAPIDTVFGRTGTVVGESGDYDADQVDETPTSKIFTSDERVKLQGIADNATSNSPDAVLLNRANHTGTQLLSTISDSGTAAALDVGTGPDEVVQLDGSSKLPAVDGSALTNLSTGQIEVYDEFIPVETAATRLNFTGTGVTATDAGAGQVDVTIAAGAAPIDTVFGRTGAVVAQPGDYDADQITETATNKVMLATERTKLSGVEDNATADQSDAEIRAAVDAATDSNVFTDAYKTQLDANVLNVVGVYPSASTDPGSARDVALSANEIAIHTGSGWLFFRGNTK